MIFITGCRDPSCQPREHGNGFGVLALESRTWTYRFCGRPSLLRADRDIVDPDHVVDDRQGIVLEVLAEVRHQA